LLETHRRLLEVTVEDVEVTTKEAEKVEFLPRGKTKPNANVK